MLLEEDKKRKARIKKAIAVALYQDVVTKSDKSYEYIRSSYWKWSLRTEFAGKVPVFVLSIFRAPVNLLSENATAMKKGGNVIEVPVQFIDQFYVGEALRSMKRIVVALESEYSADYQYRYKIMLGRSSAPFYVKPRPLRTTIK